MTDLARSCRRLLTAGTCLVALAGPPTGATAGSVPLEHDPNFPIDLGAVPKYPSEAAAVAACQPDAVVWADRRTGYVYPRYSEAYGKSPNGTFTCLKTALDADYWTFGISANFGGKGREFPDHFPCTQCM
ncbi:MAG: hypothetical protein P4L98_11850 [Ancalomicrobiaceae bacterium]|nr:hypothetical protein [Ancalomicrobiaceae bacterium]